MTEEAAEDRLRRSGYLALRDIACEVRGGVARLRGRLPTQYLKQVAQAIVAEVEGVIAVSNEIEVIAPRNDSPIGRGDASGRGAPIPTRPSSEAQAEPPTSKEPRTMLVLARKVHQAITISDNIRITVLRIGGGRVRLGVETPEDLTVIREELLGPTDPGTEAGGPPMPSSAERPRHRRSRGPRRRNS
jgi:carbon storage regulator